MEKMRQPAVVREQYRTESRLEMRRSVWLPGPDGQAPQDVAAAAVCRARPDRVLEVGCGTGAFAARIAEENPGAIVLATDQSERLVELTAERGLRAEVADVQRLAYADGSFDVVVAMWMLYHVTELDQGLSEIRRVLRPGGTLVAATNGTAHLAELMAEAGGRPLVTQFNSEDGAGILGRHFGSVEQENIATQAVFADHAAAVAYLATFDEGLARDLPPFVGSGEYAGATSVFVAR